MKKLNSFEMLVNKNANDMYSRLNIFVEEVNGLGLTQISQPDVVRKILSVLPIDKYGHIVIALHQMDLLVATPTQILGKINAHEMYMHINDKDGSSSKRKDLALKANQENKGKAKVQIEEESSGDDDLDANIALMVRKTTKILKKLIEKVSSLTQDRRSSSPVKGSPSPKWTAIIVENSVILLINTTSPRRTSSRAIKMMTVMMRKRKRNSSRERMGSTKDSIRRKMERHTLLVTGSLTLSPQTGLLQVKKKMMKKLPLSLGTSLHHHHHPHPLLTYASWLKVNERYKLRMILLMIVIVMMSLLHLPMMN
jgi:hypothetical protein